jgi:hypothetical protein
MTRREINFLMEGFLALQRSAANDGVDPEGVTDEEFDRQLDRFMGEGLRSGMPYDVKVVKVKINKKAA